MSAQTKRNLLIAAAIIVVGALIAVMAFMTGKRPERQTPPPSRPTVAVVEVTPDAEPVRVSGFGSVKAKRSVDLVPQVSGRVVSRSARLEPGAYIATGEVLLRIEDIDYTLAVEQARSNVAQMEVNLARAREEAQVARREWDRLGAAGFGGEEGAEPTPLVLHEPQLKLAEASLAASEAALTQAEVNLARCTITAPFDGRVLQADIDVGQFLAAGQPVGSVYATDVAEITVPVADSDLAWITVGDGGDPVEIVADFAGAEHRWRGRAVRLGGAVDSRSRMVPVVVEIPAPYERSDDRPALVEGMFVEILFTSPPPAGAVIVPRAALRPGDFMWVVDGERNLRIRQVTVARAGIEQAVVTGGLAAGELVCTSNLQYVTDGMPVRIEGERAPTAPTEKPATEDGER
ncbi:MAG: efflux RND transporter periplasmic adaptor subunit [bacterium]|nr:efflux RND transporter periplasmic adaptor subunit [bacterium]